MASEHLGRRQLLTAAGVGVVAAAGMGGTAAAGAPSVGSDGWITGGWLITRKDVGTPGTIQAVLTFAAGGAFLALDINPASSPLAGSWESEGDHRFAATFYGSASDPQGDMGTVRVHATGRVDGDRISGSYTVRVSLGGQTQTGKGSFQGSRIEPD